MSKIILCQKQPPEVFCKKGVLRNFSKFTGGLRPATLLKKRLWYRYFPVNFAKFQNTFLYRTSLVAASDHKTAREQVLNARTMLRDSLLHEEKLTNR